MHKHLLNFFLILVILFTSSLLTTTYGQKKVWGAKASIGYSPIWNLGLTYHFKKFGFDFTFSTDDAAEIKADFEDRYNRDLEGGTYMIDLSMWGMTSRWDRLKKGRVAFEYGGSVSYNWATVEVKNVPLSGTINADGNVWGFGIFIGLHHNVGADFYFLEYRIGYRFYSTFNANASVSNHNYEYSRDGSELNTVFLAVSWNFLFL